MLSNQDQQLIQQYLHQQLSSNEQQAVVNRIQADANFRQEMLMAKLILKASQSLAQENSATGLQKAKELAQQLGDDLFLGNDPAEAEDWEIDVDVRPTYSLNELLQMFQPIGHYERQLAGKTRSGRGGRQLPMVKPENGEDYPQTLPITFSEAISTTLTISIYNSQDEIIVEQEEVLDKEETTSIDTTHLAPGRYYLKVRATGYVMSLRSFFIQKGLMPQ